MTVFFKNLAAASCESSIPGEGGCQEEAGGSGKIASDKGTKGRKLQHSW